MPLKKPLLPDEQVYFIHVPKCAGTSFISLVDEHYVIDEILPVHYDLEKFRKEITDEQLSQYKFIRGHIPYDLVIPRLLGIPRVITFLRDPVAQFISYFEMRQRVSDPSGGLQPALQSLTLEDFLEREDLVHDTHFHRRFTNWATWLIGGVTKSGKREIPNLKRAKERLAKFDFVGITERFDESLELFCYTFGFAPIGSSRSLNVSPNREERANIDAKILHKIAEVNWADVELYKFGCALLENQLREMKVRKPDDSTAQKVNLLSSINFTFERVDPGSGWQVAESHPRYGVIRWSGPETTSTLYMPVAAQNDLIIRFRVVSSIAPDILNSLTLSVNNYSVALTQRHDGTQGGVVFEGSIPHTMLVETQARQSISFHVNRTLAPKELGQGSEDERALGLCYHWLAIYPA